jgi:hypothetical protein
LVKQIFFWQDQYFSSLNLYILAKLISFLATLLHFIKTFFIFWLNHYLFGIAHMQENPKGTMEGDDYHQ